MKRGVADLDKVALKVGSHHRIYPPLFNPDLFEIE